MITVPSITYGYVIFIIYALGRIFGNICWIFGPNITYHVKGGIVGYTKIIKLGLAKLYHGRDHYYDYMILRICLLGPIFGHFSGVVGPNIIYHMKGGVVGHRNITKFALAKIYHAPDHGSKSYFWVCGFNNLCI